MATLRQALNLLRTKAEAQNAASLAYDDAVNERFTLEEQIVAAIGNVTFLYNDTVYRSDTEK